jgi:hypothetical protein
MPGWIISFGRMSVDDVEGRPLYAARADKQRPRRFEVWVEEDIQPAT